MYRGGAEISIQLIIGAEFDRENTNRADMRYVWYGDIWYPIIFGLGTFWGRTG